MDRSPADPPIEACVLALIKSQPQVVWRIDGFARRYYKKLRV
jgi:hypothetical protein